MSDSTDNPSPSPACEQMTWMIFEDNKAWAIRKRPKFVVKGTAEAVESLIKRLEQARYVLGHDMSSDTYLRSEPIRSFESVESYDAQETEHFEKMMQTRVAAEAAVSFSGFYPSTKRVV